MWWSKGAEARSKPDAAAPLRGWAPLAVPALMAAGAAGLASAGGGSAALVAALAFVSALTGCGLLSAPRSGGPSSRRAGGADELGDDVRQRVLAVVADSVPDAVVLFSDVGTIRYSNPVARELFFEGQNPEGQNFIRLLSDAAAPLREALLGETDRFFSVQVEGRLESYHLSRRNFLADAEPLTLLIVKYMTREIRRREVEVLQRVVRVMSHEVNNSLAPISSLLHSARLMANNLGQAERFQRVFDTIDERASHLRTFLEGYAALARLPRPRLAEASWAPVLAQLGALFPELRRPEPPELPGWFDSGQLEQLLINLVKNAHEAGSPPSAVELELSSQPDGSSELCLLDRGPGFSAEAMQNAVLPLYTTKPGGSGMGLALSREIAEAHGGSLDVSNRKDGGACIQVRLSGRKSRAAHDLTRSRLTLTRH